MKIAILASGSLKDRKGLFNAAHNRIKHLKAISNEDIEAYLISYYPAGLMRLLTGAKKRQHPEIEEYDGIQYNIIWIPDYLIDYLSEVKLHRRRYLRDFFFKRLATRFKTYDVLIAHSDDCGYVANIIKSNHKIPFLVTWHGSDIHYSPFHSNILFKRVKDIIKNASCNFFVSKNLLDVSDKITPDGTKMVLYNGCDPRFFKMSDAQRRALREQNGVKDEHVVTFSGSLLPIKNTLVLPQIYRIVAERDSSVVFWFVGDGKMRSELENLCQGLNVKFWGNQPSEKMPEYMNMTDVLVLPSLNEGLPLVAAEAMNCGAHAVGSRAGGIPEVMGLENTFELDSPTFVQDFADRILYFLNEGKESKQQVASCFDWNETAKIENDIIEKCHEQ